MFSDTKVYFKKKSISIISINDSIYDNNYHDHNHNESLILKTKPRININNKKYITPKKISSPINKRNSKSKIYSTMYKSKECISWLKSKKLFLEKYSKYKMKNMNYKTASLFGSFTSGIVSPNNKINNSSRDKFHIFSENRENKQNNKNVALKKHSSKNISLFNSNDYNYLGINSLMNDKKKKSVIKKSKMKYKTRNIAPNKNIENIKKCVINLNLGTKDKSPINEKIKIKTYNDKSSNTNNDKFIKPINSERFRNNKNIKNNSSLLFKNSMRKISRKKPEKKSCKIQDFSFEKNCDIIIGNKEKDKSSNNSNCNNSTNRKIKVIKIKKFNKAIKSNLITGFSDKDANNENIEFDTPHFKLFDEI